jgi:hypothetical protein
VSGKGLLAIGLAVIAAVFLALVIQSRSDEDDGERLADDHDQPRLEKRETCATAVGRALDAAGDHIVETFGTDARSRVRAVAERRCREDKWPADVTSCLEGASDASSLSRCIGTLDPEAHAALMAELERLPRDTPPPDADIDAPAPRFVQDDDGPPACVAYGKLIERMSTCDQLPEATRRALTDAYAQVRQSWKSIPRDTWASLDAGCEQAVEAMKQAMASMCP